MKNSDDFSPVVGHGVIKEAKILDPAESLTAQIQRRSGIVADQIDTVLLRYHVFSSPKPNPTLLYQDTAADLEATPTLTTAVQ